MAVKCISCGKKIKGEPALIYAYATDEATKEKVETIFHLHNECYDVIAQTVPVAGTKPLDERLIEVDGGEEEPF